MIIWQDLGFLAILILAILIAALELLLGKGDPALLAHRMEMALLVSAIIVWFAGSRLKRGAARELIDPETQEKILLKKMHTTFWLPMQWFAMVLAAVAVYALVAPSFDG